jgi:hypothetical protein
MIRLVWRLLGVQLIFAIMSVSVAVTLGWLYWNDYWQLKNSYAQQQLVARQVLIETQSRMEKKTLEGLVSSDVARLRQQGWLGSQSRLKWIDNIVALSRDSVIDGVQLRFSERVPLVKERLAGITQVPSGVNSEVLSAEAFFMHEWDALQWIDRIQKDHGMPLSLLSSCQLKLMSTESAAHVDFPVFASCRWLLVEVLDE